MIKIDNRKRKNNTYLSSNLSVIKLCSLNNQIIVNTSPPPPILQLYLKRKKKKSGLRFSVLSKFFVAIISLYFFLTFINKERKKESSLPRLLQNQEKVISSLLYRTRFKQDKTSFVSKEEGLFIISLPPFEVTLVIKKEVFHVNKDRLKFPQPPPKNNCNRLNFLHKLRRLRMDKI